MAHGLGQLEQRRARGPGVPGTAVAAHQVQASGVEGVALEAVLPGIPEPGPAPSSTTWCSRHSIWKGDSATRSGFTRRAGDPVNPALTNSSTPSGYSALATFICWTMAWLTAAMTNSRVAMALR